MKTSEVAKIIGVHPNTIRMYEEIGFISKPNRLPNGYRVYTPLHVKQMELARVALRSEMLQSGLRKKAIEIVRLCAKCDFEEAIAETRHYEAMLEKEIKSAEEAICSVESILQKEQQSPLLLKRKQAAELVAVTVDTLRNWEMNGLIKVRRLQNGYRVYDEIDIERLKIVRTLRCANYSLAAILRLLNKLSTDENIVVEEALNMPEDDEDIVSACDRLIVSLKQTKGDAAQMLSLLKVMEEEYKTLH